MARSNYYVNPQEKKLETFSNFTGGLNTVTTNDNLSDTELTFLENADLDTRGNVTRRIGMQLKESYPILSDSQGYFRYYKPDGTYDELVAYGGRLLVNGTLTTIINLGTPEFQSTRKIEAVQFQGKLYIATGTKLVVYDGTTCKVVDPYKPDGQEALYIGFNGLFPDPTNYATDSTDVFNAIDTVIFDKRYGVVNKNITTTIIVTKIAGDILEYKTEVQKVGDTSWTLVKDFATAATGKTVTYKPTSTGDYSYRVTIRKQGTTGQDIVYTVPKYTVNATDTNNQLSVATMQTCNRIFIHNDRICMYGDTTNPNQMYFSHLNKPAYFPTNNTLDFKNDRQEGISSVVKYRGILVVFTPSTIEALYGTNPLDFTKKTLNASLGCNSPYSACVVENSVYFVSKEGVYSLVSVGTVDDRMNVRRLDENIWNILPKDIDCVGVYFDKQYHLVYPTQKLRFRYYTQLNTWTRDKSDKMDLTFLMEWDGLLFAQRKRGSVVFFDPRATTVMKDIDEVYSFIVETKYFDFGQPYHPKVLRQMQIMMGVPEEKTSNFAVYVYADASLIIGQDRMNVGVDGLGNITWTPVVDNNQSISPGTTLGSWIMGKSTFGNVDSIINRVMLSGKCRQTKFKLVQTEDNTCSFLGLSYQFKLKKPK